jgi:RHS repeat-associated protein
MTRIEKAAMTNATSKNKGSFMLVQRFVKIVSFIVLAIGCVPWLQAQNLQSVLKSSQSLTLLPDGHVLLLGGLDASGSPVGDAYLVDASNKAKKLPVALKVPRTGHTATVLPNGLVLIFGGVGPGNELVQQVELFDPSTLTLSELGETRLIPRAYHTATVLTDGKVLIVGGVESGGQFPDDVQLWDWKSGRALSHHAALFFAREGHTARLLTDGTVLISGGTNRLGQHVSDDEIFDPISKRFSLASHAAQNADDNVVKIDASLPVDGATDVPVDEPIAVRFTQLLDVVTTNQRTFVLSDGDGNVVAGKVTAAENGRLVFVLPAAPLQPGAAYTLDIQGAQSKGVPLQHAVIRFQTEGEPSSGSSLDWVPNATWTDTQGITKFQDLSSLQAAPGSTALSGQVLKLNGWPLQHVTLEVDGKQAHSDSTGRFLLTGLTAGHHVLWIDASSANTTGAVYGTYEVGVTILPNKTNVLNYTIWMARLDTAHAVEISSSSSAETVITNPLLPGLELHLPPHTVITDRHGKPVHQVSITPIPLNKPPFPLPAGVDVPIYFTIQPGGAYIKVLGSGAGPKGATLTYPNAFKFTPNTVFELWNYDAEAKGWYVYGHGRVSSDGKSVFPDPGVEIYEFTGAMETTPNAAGGQALSTGQFVKDGDPVSLATGQFVYTKTDLALPDVTPINFTRTYISNDSHSRAFGIGTTHAYDMFMIGDQGPWTYQELVLPDGSRVRFDRISAGTSWLDAVYAHATSGTPFYGARITWNQSPEGWIMKLKDGTVITFPNAASSTSSFMSAPLQIVDRFGNRTLFTRDSLGHLTQVSSPNGRYINVTNDSSGRITQLQDNAGRTVHYTYDTGGRLSTVTDVNGGITTYTYDDQNRMLTIKDARQIVYLTNEYDAAGRVKKQTNADTGSYLYTWTPTANTSQTHFYAQSGFTGTGGIGGTVFLHSGCWNGNGLDRSDPECIEGYMPLVAQVDVADARGYIRRVVFNTSGYVTSDTHALGQPEEETVTYSYFSDNLLQSVTDPLGRKTSFDYDGNGNRTRVTRLDGTSNAVTTTFTYEPQFNQLASVTDPLSHTTSFSYDQNGNLTTAADPLNHSVTLAHNSAGQVTSATDSLNNSLQFGYFGGDLVSVTDPLGNTSTSFHDAAGRIISATDALGNTVQTQYNPLNLVTQVTDPKGNNTTFSYDPNGNLLSLTDALHLTTPTTWTYDNMDRALTRTDPLLRHESYSYDLEGNLVSSTDRKSQVTSLTYDPLNRMKLVGYNTVVNAGVTSYESTVGYTYDGGNRMTQAVDSAGGTITEAYDNLDRLTSETTPQGQISYGYDLAGRRASMTVAGQPQVTYSYDNANRLTQIAQGTSTVGFSYDTANRRSTLTLSNGVNMSYTYDNDSRVTGITYKFNANTLGNLTYSYDSLGRRTQVGGSFAQTGLPGTVASATYDVANELTNWNGTAISYDNNGNMLTDGSNAFTWNARNRVASLNNVNLQYDAMGRRIKNAAGTSFLFDRANTAQELSGSTVTANLLSGGVDEVFSRTDTLGTFTPLRDALGSTIALVDATGNLVTSYSYDPFGNTIATGTSNSNEFQYTGRENEGNGLYFYRARYYSPLLGRFINEDPIRFGNNFYRYVSDNPINFVDPFGLRDYNEQETLQWLQNAYNSSTAGFFQGLWNIRNNSQGGGPYDFGHDPTGVHQGDTWTRCGIKMSAGDFGNYIAGFQGGAYDRKFNQAVPGTSFASGLVALAGIYYHATGDTDVPNDPWDKTGMPWINSGIDDGYNFRSYPLENPVFYPKDNGKCGCK